MYKSLVCFFGLCLFGSCLCGQDRVDDTDRLIHSYRTLIYFALSTPQVEYLEISDQQKEQFLKGMLGERDALPKIDENIVLAGGFDKFVASIGLAASVSDVHCRQLWESRFNEQQKRLVIASYLGSYGIRGFYSPAVQSYFGLSKKQQQKMMEVLAAATEVDRRVWLTSQDGSMPENLMCLHSRLGLADRFLDTKQMEKFKDLVNESSVKFNVTFTLGF